MTAQENGVICVTATTRSNLPMMVCTDTLLRSRDCCQDCDGLNWKACNAVIAGGIINYGLAVRSPDFLLWEMPLTCINSIDGGDSWTKLTNWPYAGLRSIPDIGFVNDWVGYMLSYSTLMRTIDGGFSWEIISRESPSAQVMTIAVGDENYILYGGGVVSQQSDWRTV